MIARSSMKVKVTMSGEKKRFQGQYLAYLLCDLQSMVSKVKVKSHMGQG